MRSCNQCYKFETHTDMAVASAADLAAASAQGTILLIEYGSAWYGNGTVGDVRSPQPTSNATNSSSYQSAASYGTTNSSSYQSESSYGDGVDTSEGGLNDNDDSDDPIAAIPGSNGHRRGWVFNMIPTTLPPASAGDSDSAMGGDDANGDKGG